MKTTTATPDRQQILDELASLRLMQRGTVSEHYVRRASPDGKSTVHLGPYHKFQVWRDGRNHTRSVSAEEADLLRGDTAAYRRFEELCSQLALLNTEHTLALRNAQAAAGAASGKKNSARKRAAKGSTKPKPSSRGPGRS